MEHKEHCLVMNTPRKSWVCEDLGFLYGSWEADGEGCGVSATCELQCQLWGWDASQCLSAMCRVASSSPSTSLLVFKDIF